MKKTKLIATALIMGLLAMALPPGRTASAATAGSLDTSFLGVYGANSSVFATALQSDGKMLIGGRFTNYAGAQRGRIARLNVDGSLDTTFAVGVGADQDIDSISIQGDGKIMIVGNFWNYNGVLRNHIARLNTDGTLDTTFTTGTGANSAVNSIAIQSDGKYVVGGWFTSYNGTARGYVARINADGSLDTTFATGVGADSGVNSVAIQSDGKIIIGGQFASYNGTARGDVARLNTDGSLDTTFATGAGVNTGGAVYAFIIQSDGKILIGGWISSYNGTARGNVARLNTDGTLDTTFATGAGADNSISSIATQSDGKVLVGGSFANYNGTARGRIARLNTDGTLDATFTTVAGSSDTINTIFIQSNGKIIIGGQFMSYNTAICGYFARLNADGSLDTSLVTGAGVNNSLYSMAIQSDGKIVIVGIFTSYNGIARGRIARLNTDGTLDTTFATGAGADAQIFDVAIQSDGKIIIGGWFTTYNGTARKSIARLNTDGSLDATFTPGTGANSYVETIAVQSDGKVMIGGNFTSYNGTTLGRIARLNTDGTLDTIFTTAAGANDIVYSIGIQSSGKIVIGGNFTTYRGTARGYVARLNTDGTLDAAFASGGGANAWLQKVVVQSNDKVFISGNFTTYNGTARGGVARLNTDGTLDTTFTTGAGANGVTSAAAIQTDGKIIIGGNFSSYDGVARGHVARLKTDGSLDVVFATGLGADSGINSLAIQSDGKIVIAGSLTYDDSFRPYIARLDPGPMLDLKASASDGPLAVTYGATTTLTWAGSSVSGCSASGAWSGAKSMSGSEVSMAVIATSTFNLGCDLASDTVIVIPGPAPLASISVASTSIAYGSLAQVRWDSSNVSGCNVNSVSGSATTTISNIVSSTGAGGSPYITNGPITATTTYSIDCTNSVGYHSAPTSTTVVVPVPPTGGIIAQGTPATCSIASGASSCSSSVAWNILGAMNPEVWLMNAGTTTKTRLSTVASGTLTTVYTAGPGSYYWSANADGTTLTANYLVAVTCATGTAWSASLNKCVTPPTITWTANGVATSTPTFGEGDLNSFSYTSTDAATCDYFNPATSTSPNFSATTSSWSNLAYWSSWSAKVVCTNPAGTASSTFTPIIASNNSALTVVTLPEYFAPGETKTVFIKYLNTGTKRWDNTDVTPHKMCLTPAAALAGWTIGGAACASIGGTIPPGSSFTPGLSLKAPATEGDYPFGMILREDGLKNTDGTDVNSGSGYYFGQTGAALGDTLAINGSGNSNPIPPGYIRVKNPTLVVAPITYSLPDTVVGDPATNYPINIWNIGGGTISTGNAISGYTAPFSGSSTFTTLGAGTSTPVIVSFTPTATTSYSNIITVSSAGQTNVNVTLLGTGIDQFTFMQSTSPSASRITGDFDFGNTQGISGAYRRVFVKNNSVNRSSGTTTLSLLVSGTTSPIFLCVDNCSFNDIAPGQVVWSKWWFHPPIIPRDATPLSFSGTATWTFTGAAKSLVGVIRGWSLPVRIEFREQ